VIGHIVLLRPEDSILTGAANGMALLVDDATAVSSRGTGEAEILSYRWQRSSHQGKGNHHGFVSHRTSSG
jgi:hypothetical protein